MSERSEIPLIHRGLVLFESTVKKLTPTPGEQIHSFTWIGNQPIHTYRSPQLEEFVSRIESMDEIEQVKNIEAVFEDPSLFNEIFQKQHSLTIKIS